ncbi:MAG: hypothetical protein M1813_005451 [Trichoglossum hirsutum]|nr:MAG: hypothetical protein M1813_005451 [Trichoglossum hirsutum]
MNIIEPAKESRFYPLIIGEDGTGKTSLIRLALEKLSEPKGVIYANYSTGSDFTETLQEALGWYPDKSGGGGKGTSLEVIWELFSDFATKYKQIHKKVPVLIIDNVNTLAEDQEDTLKTLLEYAKLATDDSIATFVFVSDEGGVPRQMVESSSWSRHGDILKVGDISKEEALKYLGDQGIKGEEAAQIYELVGGRIVHLIRAAEHVRLHGQSLQGVREMLLHDAESLVSRAGMGPSNPDVKEGERSHL